MATFAYKDKKSNFGSIELDAMLEQNITLSNRVSSRPLENGKLLNDAIHNQPVSVSFVGIVTDSPQTHEENSALNVDRILNDEVNLSNSKKLRAWSDIYQLWKSRTLVMVSSPLQIEPFSDMAILNIGVDLDPTDALIFRVELAQVLYGQKLKKRTLAPQVGKQSQRA